jgi:hypothetical protein
MTTEIKFDVKYYDYLDELRDSGETNMFGAGPYLVETFEELNKAQAKAIALDWMETFGKRQGGATE